MLAKFQSFFKPVPSDIGVFSTPTLVPSSKILIVGSGCFGISTALHLLRRGYKDVVVIDRAPELPAADAASTDINKIVRSSYHDEFYTCLAREAVEAWRDRAVWGDNFHESGVLVCGTGASVYADDALLNDLKHGVKIKKLSTVESTIDESVEDHIANKGLESITLPEIFNSGIPLGENIANTHGYLNIDGGWVYSTGGVERAMQLVRELGGQIIPGKEVISLIKSGPMTKGVKCGDGSEFTADVVVLATGSWTASAFPELNLGERAHATGQSVVAVKLTPEEGERYRDIPVVLDFGPSGFYCFPPDKDNIIKLAHHYGGVANFVPLPNAPTVDAASAKISTPRTILSHGEDGMKILKSEVPFLRKSFQRVYPELAHKPFHFTRMCWYTDSPDSSWIIDVHPEDPGLALVTAGSGHGFKFLPVIGRLVADRLEGKMDEATRKKFAMNRTLKEGVSYREGATIGILKAEELFGLGDN